MEAFNGGQQVLSLSDLNKRTRLPKSTLHRLVDQLCQVGWLERDHGGYRVGMRMFELGTLAVDGNRLHEAAFPHLQALLHRAWQGASGLRRRRHARGDLCPDAAEDAEDDHRAGRALGGAQARP
jgi:DNA-binding IclR family transcriptional regulator